MITLRYRCKSTTSMQKLYEPKYENKHQVVLLSKLQVLHFVSKIVFYQKSLSKSSIFSQKPRFIPF